MPADLIERMEQMIADLDRQAGYVSNMRSPRTDNDFGRTATLMEIATIEIKRLREALDFYADPENYHAVAFMADPPCGGFADDFDEDHGHPDYPRAMPGKLARSVLSTQS